MAIIPTYTKEEDSEFIGTIQTCTAQKTLLDELETLDTLLQEGDPTAAEERRGLHLVGLANAAPALRDSLLDIVTRFKSRIANDKDSVEGDMEAIEMAEVILAETGEDGLSTGGSPERS